MDWNNINKPLFRIEIFLSIQRTSMCWINIRFLTFLVDNLCQQKQLNCLVKSVPRASGTFKLAINQTKKMDAKCPVCAKMSQFCRDK